MASNESRRIKILFVFGPLGGGGSERQFALLIENLDREKFEPIVASVGMDPREAEEHLARNPAPFALDRCRSDLHWAEITRYHTYRKLRDVAQIYFIPRPSKLALFRPMAGLYRIIGVERPDIVFCISEFTGLLAGPASWLRGCRHRILGLRGARLEAEEHRPNLRIRVLDFLLRWVCRQVMTGFVANSHALLDHCHQVKGYRGERMRVIYNGVSEHPRDPEKGKIPSGDAVRIGIIGRLYPVKDHRTLLRAASLIPITLPVKFLVIGNGPLDRELEQLARDLGLEKRVSFLGWVPEVSEVLSQLDIVVLTSTSEGFNNSIAEAQMHGIPVVTTDAPGCSEIVVDGETGFVVPIGSAESVARAVEKLAGDASLRKRFGTTARTRSQELFSVGRMVGQYQDLFMELVGREA